MVEFFKINDQYPRRFNFGHLISFIIVLPLSAGKIDFDKALFEGNG